MNGLRNLLIVFSCSMIVLCSCEKPAGEGGLGSITGKVFAREYTSSGVFKSEYFAPDEKVYIVYGDHPIYNDETRTHLDGTFRFNYLNKGDYTIFVYSECDTCATPITAIQETISITQRGEQVSVPLITITK